MLPKSRKLAHCISRNGLFCISNFKASTKVSTSTVAMNEPAERLQSNTPRATDDDIDLDFVTTTPPSLPPEVANMPTPAFWRPFEQWVQLRFAGYSPPSVKSVVETRNADALASGMDVTGLYPKPSDFWYGKLLPIESIQYFLESFHTMSGVPFWSIIVAVPFITKICLTIPSAIIVNRRYERILPKIPDALIEYNAALQRYSRDAKRWNAESKLVYHKYGFNPYLATLRPMQVALLQIPIHISFYTAFKTMQPKYDNLLQTGGFGWVTDLSKLDSTMILPISCGVGVAMCTYVMAIKAESRGSFKSRKVLKVGALTSVTMVYIAMYSNVAFHLYLLSNVSSYVIQSYMFSNNRFRSIFGLQNEEFLRKWAREIRQVSFVAQRFEDRKKATESRDIIGANKMERITGMGIPTPAADAMEVTIDELSDSESEELQSQTEEIRFGVIESESDTEEMDTNVTDSTDDSYDGIDDIEREMENLDKSESLSMDERHLQQVQQCMTRDVSKSWMSDIPNPTATDDDKPEKKLTQREILMRMHKEKQKTYNSDDENS